MDREQAREIARYQEELKDPSISVEEWSTVYINNKKQLTV